MQLGPPNSKTHRCGNMAVVHPRRGSSVGEKGSVIGPEAQRSEPPRSGRLAKLGLTSFASGTPESEAKKKVERQGDQGRGREIRGRVRVCFCRLDLTSHRGQRTDQRQRDSAGCRRNLDPWTLARSSDRGRRRSDPIRRTAQTVWGGGAQRGVCCSREPHAQGGCEELLETRANLASLVADHGAIMPGGRAVGGHGPADA